MWGRSPNPFSTDGIFLAWYFFFFYNSEICVQERALLTFYLFIFL